MRRAKGKAVRLLREQQQNPQQQQQRQQHQEQDLPEASAPLPLLPGATMELPPPAYEEVAGNAAKYVLQIHSEA